VSSPWCSPGDPEPSDLDWARLIPGETPALSRGQKRPMPSVSGVPPSESLLSPTNTPREAGKALDLLIPSPLRGRLALRWTRSVAADAALVGLNWLLLGALLVPLHARFPQVHLFTYAAGRPLFLLGIGVLHASLITLTGHIEELYAVESDLRAQARILCKTVLWATAILGFAYGLQGAAWAATALI